MLSSKSHQKLYRVSTREHGERRAAGEVGDHHPGTPAEAAQKAQSAGEADRPVDRTNYYALG
jgi:hypothetical protein